MSLAVPKSQRLLSNAHRRSAGQERELAKRLGADRIPGSGAGRVKGDVRKKGVMRLEAKTTTKASFSLTVDMVRKITEAAMGAGELPVMAIEFLGPNGKPTHRVAVVPDWVLEIVADTEQ